MRRSLKTCLAVRPIARAVLGAALLLPAFSLVGAGRALAAGTPGTLTYSGCIAEPGGDLCGTQGHGLSSPYALTLSPDGSNVYVGAPGKNSLTTLTRSAQGQIGFGSCLSYVVGAEIGRAHV